MTPDHTDVEVALAAAAAGAAAVRSRYGADLAQLAKSPTDFATEADLAAEEAIHRVISTARPSDGFEGEETGTSVGSSDRRWLVDPLCGTLNFAASTPLSAVNVALETPSGVTAAVSADPISEEFFWTDGTGAWVRRGDVDQPLAPSPRSLIVDVNCDGKTRCVVRRRAAHRRPGLPRPLRPARPVQHPRRLLGRSWSPGRVRHRRTPGRQRALRCRDRALPGRWLHRHGLRRQPRAHRPRPHRRCRSVNSPSARRACPPAPEAVGRGRQLSRRVDPNSSDPTARLRLVADYFDGWFRPAEDPAAGGFEGHAHRCDLRRADPAVYARSTRG